MKYLIYAAACWPVVSVIVAALVCREIHKAKVRATR
jgi:hypothetical protein